jgi:8-oxo-dGTP pyrophosphatase MutT (NUDIX family)
VPTPDFITRLRETIGHDMLWLPGATAVVFDGDMVLLVKRADDGEWTPVTGIVDPGELPSDTAVREVMEETAVACAVESLAWVNVTAVKEYSNGDQAQYLDHTFRCRYLSGHARVADDESSEVGWFPIDELPLMNLVHRERIITARGHAGPTRLDPFVPPDEDPR